ncbi:MAG TPA: hypothetical protein VK558_08285 [Patescibacteria group bacterium]|nr:hypothetical protein [Patescibacteria group bacterium]
MRRPIAAEVSLPLPANDNAAAGNSAHAGLIPLVRLLARQAARDWLKQAANDNQAAGKE